MSARALAGAHGLDASPDSGQGASSVPATDVEYRWDPQRTCELLADTLARLHRVPVDPAAAVERLGPEAVVAVAEERQATGAPVDPDPPYRHVPPERLLEILRDGAGALATAAAADPVLTHGDATLETLRCRAGEAVGFVHWDGAAVADRHRDLAVAATSVATLLGPMLVPAFFDRYGMRPDPVLLDWWALAHQLTRDPAGATP